MNTYYISLQITMRIFPYLQFRADNITSFKYFQIELFISENFYIWVNFFLFYTKYKIIMKE